MNKRIVSQHPENWTDADVESRTSEIENVILQLWPVPVGHKVDVGAVRSAKTKREVLLTHLLEAAYIKVGQVLYPRRGKYAGRNAVVLDDGSIELEGHIYDSPSGAGRFLTGKPTAGWHFWLVNPESRQMLWDVRQQYIEALSVDIEVVDDEEDDDDEEDSN
jgi:hypothetical protein